MTMESPENSLPAREASWIEAALAAGEPSAWSKAEIARLFVVPAFVVLLFAGGVYLVKRSWSAESANEGPPSTIQVRLIPRPDQTPIPIETATQTAESRDLNVNSKSSPSEKPTVDEQTVRPPEQTSSSVESQAPGISRVTTPTKVVSNSALAKFQQNLINHIAKFQHYPAAAHNKLQGTVGTFFSIDRNGHLLGVWVRNSSGQMLLDDEAIQTIKRAQPLPSIPSELPDRLNVQVQLAFDPS
jgi:periplasmic protein TonB